MQGHVIPNPGQVLREALVTVPASLVDWLRLAAYTEIGSAEEALDTAVTSIHREAHPERFRGPKQGLDETYALLDAIGWAKTTPPLGVMIDLGEDGWTLMRVLTNALEFAEDDISETASGKVKHAEQQDLAPEPNGDVKRIGVLSRFIDAVQARIDALAVRVEEGAALEVVAA